MAGTFPGYALVGIVIGVPILLIVLYNIVSLLRKKRAVADVEAVDPEPAESPKHATSSQETLPSYQIAMGGNERLPDGIVLHDK